MGFWQAANCLQKNLSVTSSDYHCIAIYFVRSIANLGKTKERGPDSACLCSKQPGKGVLLAAAGAASAALELPFVKKLVGPKRGAAAVQ